MIHIGQRIKEVFDRQPKDHDIMWLAGRLNCKRANVYNIFNRATLDVQLLFQISQILEHDFFHDLSGELLQSKGEILDEKQRIYDDMMFSMGRLLQRQLRRVSIAGKAPGYQLNRWDGSDSPLPADKYIVSVKSGEDADVPPHIHLYSIEEQFELRYTIPNYKEEGLKLLPVRHYGNRDEENTFFDITQLVEEWFKPKMGRPLVTHGTYKLYALMMYNTLNPYPHLRNMTDGY